MRVRAIRPGDLVIGISARCRSLGRPAWAATIVGATILFVSHVSSGRQVEQETIRAKVVVAETFLLDEAGGDKAAMFGVDPAGQGSLVFFGRKTPFHLQIGNFKPGPGIALLKENPKTRMELTVFRSDYASLRLATDVPPVKLKLGAWDDDTSDITFENQDSEILSLRGSGEGLGIRLRLSRKKGGPAIVLADSNRLTQASMVGHDGQVRTLVGLNAVQGPALQIYDRAVESLLELTEQADGNATIKFTDPVTRASRSMK